MQTTRRQHGITRYNRVSIIPRPASAPRQARRRAASRLLIALCAAVPLLIAAADRAEARVGDSRAGLFIGTTTFTVESQRTFGTTFGGSYGFEFEENILWTVGGAFSSTEGDATVDDGMGGTEVIPLRASTAALQTGLVTFFNRGPNSVVIPFLGAGLSFLNYDLEYPGTTVGTTSGTAPGAYAQVGIEFRLTRNFTLIPQFGVQVHSIETETGASTGLVSGGLVFSLRISN